MSSPTDTPTDARTGATPPEAAPAATAPETAAPSTNRPARRRAPAKKAVATRAAPAARAAAPGRPAGDGSRPGPGHHRRAADRALDRNSTHLDFALGRVEVHVTLPPLDKMAFYVGLAGAAALGVVEWPVALLTGVGHLLSDDRRNRTVRALGEALDAV